MPYPTDLTIELIFSHQPWRDILTVVPLIEHAATTAYKVACDIDKIENAHEVAINLSNDKQIQSLNRQFRDKDAPTNVLSFPFDNEFAHNMPGPKPLGDIILALETITLEAKQQDKPLDHHIAHLVVHGILHLFGYDHIEEEEAQEMERLETKILASLSIPCPYGDAPIATGE